jgi:hypothetical protein
MKTKFGNLLTRIFRAGVVLMPVEKALLRLSLEELPTALKSIVESQINVYNLVQREVDGRALNFYRIKGRRVNRDDLQPLPIKSGEVKLLTVTFSIEGNTEDMHATLSAVDKFFFCLAMSECLKPYKNSDRIFIKRVKKSWRSNVVSNTTPIQRMNQTRLR